MRHRVNHFGLAVFGVLAVAVGCGGEEPDNVMVAPSGTGTGTTSAPTSTGGTSSAGTSSGATSTGGTSTGGTSTGATSAATSAEPSGPSFATDIHPIFVAKCSGNVSCHGDGETFAKIAVTDVDAAFTALGTITGGVPRITERISNGQMPMTVEGTSIAYGCATGGMQDTSKAGCLTAAEFELINTWVDAGGPK